jgi:hypothetical protein
MSLLAYNIPVSSFTEKEKVKSYARTLYTNYRARIQLSGHSIPVWRLANPVVRREFMRDARLALGY